MAPAGPRQRSSAAPLALAFAALVLYASLYPFTGWRWPPGQPLAAMLSLPWPPWRDRFDIAANLLGYLPLGTLVYGACVRGGMRPAPSAVLAVLLPSLLSYGAEVAQYFLPGRFPSLLDWVLNSAGAALGAGLAAVLQARGLLHRWQLLRERWFIRDSAGGLVLLALWPVGLLFPTPVPLAVGQVGERLRELLVGVVDEVPWAQPVHELLRSGEPASMPMPALSEAILQGLGLLAPCIVAFSVTHGGWRRVLLVAGAALLAFAASTLSTALNFGPEHALAWVTPLTPPAWIAATVVAATLSPLGARLAAGLGLIALTALIVLVAQAPADPYFAQSLRAWEQGRFIRFHGLAHWINWLWPYAAIAWLLARLAARNPG